MAWHKACGEEECEVCRRRIEQAEEYYIRGERQPYADTVLMCTQCTDKEDDNLCGQVDASDSRYNDEPYQCEEV
jgi:hypothetical protein